MAFVTATPQVAALRTDEARAAATTYREVGQPYLDAMLVGLDARDSLAPAHHSFQTVLAGWGERAIPRHPAYASFVANSGAPIEFSVAWTRQTVQVRFLAEPLAEPASLATNLRYGMERTERLGLEDGVSLSRFSLIRDLFESVRDPEPPFACWHSGVVRPGRAPEYKIYLNPALAGLARAPELVTTAMARLGLQEAWANLVEHLRACGVPVQPVTLALDLDAGPRSRVKAYFRHEDASIETIEQAAALATSHSPGSFERLYRLLVDGPGYAPRKPPQTCFAFHGDDPRPSSATFYLPLDPNVDSDAVAVERVTRLLRSTGIDEAPYLAMTEAVRPVGSSLAETHMQSYVGYSDADGGRVIVYLAPAGDHWTPC
ncbi:MAG TPA: tryptophan dimethylallyltransferase family protein [Jatrophihabitantaceae bacterium]|nr:tryptophan dimethylallyltransferase family protein [Jatrophihabitantaceae bacterium]